GIDAVEKGPKHAEAEIFYIGVESFRVGRRFLLHARRIARIESRYRIQTERDVLRGAGKQTDVVLAPGAAKRALPADDSESWLESGDAAVRRRAAHRGAGLGAVGKRSDQRGDRRRRAAARAAGDAIGVPRIVHRAEIRKRRGAAVAELVQIGFADDDRARGAQFLHQSRIVFRQPVLENLRAAGGA